MNKLNLGNDLYIKGRIGWKGLSKDEYLKNSEYRIINATSLLDGYINWNNCGFITKERYEESKEIMLQEGDILISKDGTLGKIGYVKNLPGKCTVSSGIFVLRNTIPNILNFDYLYHVLKSNVFKDFIRRNKANGSTINHLYQRDLENFEIDLPDIGMQNKIASLLNNLDNIIVEDSNISMKINDLVEKIYNYWFLQYEYPNNDNNYTYSEVLKNNIPSKWEVKTVKDCILHINTGLNPRKNFKFVDKGIKYITVKNLTEDGNINFDGCDHIDKEAKVLVNKRSKLKEKDILFASIAPLGRCVLVEENPNDWDINESVFSIRVNKNVVTSEYLYQYFMSSYFIKKAEHNATGSVFSGIRVSALESMPILVPDQVTLEKYTKIVSPLLKLKYEKEKEINKVKELIYFILPPLLNGQLQ